MNCDCNMENAHFGGRFYCKVCGMILRDDKEDFCPLSYKDIYHKINRESKKT